MDRSFLTVLAVSMLGAALSLLLLNHQIPPPSRRAAELAPETA